MPYSANPFLERMSERTTSDHEFARLFSPKILDKLNENAFDGGLHIFRSAPGAGKTTLLRAFTPATLRAFWNSRGSPDLSDSYQRLADRGLLDADEGPLILAVYLSCAAGYADLPPGAEFGQQGLFRGLFDCRVVLRTLRSLGVLLGLNQSDSLDAVTLGYSEACSDLKDIPRYSNAFELMAWAEDREQRVYSALDSLTGIGEQAVPSHVRFESVLWLQGVEFIFEGKAVAPQRLLMIDDVHKLRPKQRTLMIDELAVLRPSMPVWLAERTISLGEDLLSQGARQGREINEYVLEDMWSGRAGSTHFVNFAYNVLDKRMSIQDEVPVRSFSQCLRDELVTDDVRPQLDEGRKVGQQFIAKYENNTRYQEWMSRAKTLLSAHSIDALYELYVARILVARDEGKRQMALDLTLTQSEYDDRESGQVRAAAELFAHDELGIPYYYGRETICTMATFNVEELLSLAAALFVGIQAKQILRKPELILTPEDQEKLLQGAASRRRDFVPKSHSEGLRAQRLLDAIGAFCRTRTYASSAPYAPGVTGVRLSLSELGYLDSESPSLKRERSTLKRVLAECVAENLLLRRDSSSSTSRESGTVFYLNRTLCTYYELPLQMGGWQDVSVTDLQEWMERGIVRKEFKRFERI